jgi:2-oxoglutarate ferredoxin oxidoreductase subunit alpha
MFALGIVYWLYNRPLNFTEAFFEKKFKKAPIVVEINKRVLKAGFNYANTIEALPRSFVIAKANISSGTYRNISGNVATAWGLLAAAERANLKLFCGSYPITPATEILQELSKRKDLGAKTFQAEDEIAGICTAIGAAFTGSFAVTTTSGPGLALKAEAIGLAVMTELPLVVVNVQRGGPSTGLPTKTEQSDLLQALYGRNGESPVVVVASSTPSDCFDFAFEAGRIALEHMTPVILLTDGFLANGSEPWRIPQMSNYPAIKVPFAPQGVDYKPYARKAETLVRNWAIPGTPGHEHRIGGLEKDSLTGGVSHNPENHEIMVHTRREKVARVANDIPLQTIIGDQDAELLVVGWGGTYGHLLTTVRDMRKEGVKIALTHFNYISPMPQNTAQIFRGFKKIVVCELNLGQFASYLRSNFEDIKFLQYNKVQGLPFTSLELKDHFNSLLNQ